VSRIRVAVSFVAAVTALTTVGEFHPARATLDPAGEPDTSFDGDGLAKTGFAHVDTFAEARGLGIQTVGSRAGKVVIAGGFQDGFNEHVAVMRLNMDGTQDAFFGEGGEVRTYVGSNDLVEDVAIQSDDKVVVVGWSDNRGMVLRYQPDGALDTTFGGGDGVILFTATTNRFTRLRSVVIQPDGRIVVVGTADVSDATGRDVLVARLTAAGALDSSFGGGDGIATLSLTTPEPIPPFPDPDPPYVSGTDQGRGVSLQADGKIVFVGHTVNPAGSGCNGQGYADSQSVVGRMNVNGTLDTSFDSDGHRTPSLGTAGNCPDDAFRSVVVQSDGRIVAVGYANTPKTNVSVARFNTDGSFDTTFSDDGRLATAIGSQSDIAEDVHVHSDGRILVGAFSDGGTSGVSQLNFAAVRYTSTGALDTSFAGDGIGVYDFSGNDTLDAMAVDASGRLLLAGYSYVAGQFEDPLIAVARVATVGELDITFNGSGTFFKPLQGSSVDLAAGIAQQSVGANARKLVVVGSTDVGSQTDVGLVRYTTGGALDTSFSGDGKATADDANRNDAPEAVLVQPDDRILVVGSSYGTSGAPRATIMRFNANSGLDTGFDSDGIAALTVGTNANQWNAVALQPDGRIVVGGTVSDSSANWDLFLGRYNTDGSLDTSFDADGRVRLSLGPSFDQIQAVAVQPDGKIVAGGYTFVGQAQHFAVVRFNANGSVDTTFGGGDGIVVTQTGAGQFPRNEITGMAVQPDGRIVVGGNGNDGGGNTNNVIRLARYLANGDLDSSFGTGGIVTTNLASDRFDRVAGIGLQRDDKLVVFGHSQQLNVSSDDLVIARYNWDDGSLDTTYGADNQGYTVVARPGGDTAVGGILYANGSAAVGGTVEGSDFGAARFLGDPAPVVPGAPSLTPASDTGSSNSDRITNDTTPTVSGSNCNTGDTTILRIDASTGTPLSRALCRTPSYAVTVANPLVDGVHSIDVFARNGFEDTTTTSPVSLTVDTVANPPVITSPTPAQTITIPPSPTIRGTTDEMIAGARIEVREGNAPVCSATADVAGSWSCQSTLGPGAHTITARQTDVAGNVSANSTATAFTLKVVTTAELATSASPSRFGEAVTFTATVSAVPPSYGPPDGSVEFEIAGRAPQTVTLTGGVATLTVPAGSSPRLPVGRYDVEATYLGTGGFRTSSDALDPPQEVIKADTSLTWSASVSPSVTGQPVTFTATVAPLAPGAGMPTGEVELVVDGGATSRVPLADGVAVMRDVVLPVGRHILTGRYTGESSFNASSAEFAHRVERGATTVSVTSAPNPSGLGEDVTFTATVRHESPAAGTPGGSVAFVIDGASPVEIQIAGGAAVLSTANLDAGTHTVEVSYPGSSDFLPSSGGLVGGHTVNQGASTTIVTSTPNPSEFGETVEFTVSVAPVDPAATPATGEVVLDLGGAAISAALTNGQATFTTAELGIGNHPIVVDYRGDRNYPASAGTLTGGQTVERAATAISLTASPNPSVFGQSVTLTAHVTAATGTPDGSVQFTLPNGVESVPLAAGAATLIVPPGVLAPLPAGGHALVADYTGAATYEPSRATLDPPQRVDAADTTLEWTVMPAPSTFGDTVTFTADVRPVPPGAGTPTGEVAVNIDGAAGPTLTLTEGTASFTTDALGVGDHTVDGAYGGDTNFSPSTGTVDHRVERAASTITVTAAPERSRPGEPVSFTAEVTSTAGSPSGSVQFVVDGGAPVDRTLVDGTASLSLSTLAAGGHDVEATYNGNSQFAPSSATLAHTVEQGDAAVTVRADPSPTIFGASVTFTVKASPVTPAATAPTGTVTVDIDGSPTVLTLDGHQQAQLTTTNLAVGTHTVTVTYSGDENYAGDTAETVHEVTAAPTVVELASDANPSVSGRAVTFTATLTAPGSTTTPDGEVTFSIAGNKVTVSLSGGLATTTTSDLAVGDHDVTVAYPGTPSFAAGSVALARPQHVDKADTSIAATVTPDPAVSGQPLTITAAVNAVAPGAGMPAGTVAIVIDGATAAAATLDDDGTAFVHDITLGAGSHDIDVEYTGDSNFNPSRLRLDRDIGPRPVCGGRPATLVGTPGNDTLTGTAGDDVIVALRGNDTINGLGGNDAICAGAGNDRPRGAEGDDTVRGRLGNDLIVGGAGHDTVRGGQGDDIIIGRSGADVLIGGLADDLLVGRRGDDLLRGAAGDDRLDGGAGDDRCAGGDGADSATGCEFTRGLPG
jgi:uncharacterized delta-60 repeat protein